MGEYRLGHPELSPVRYPTSIGPSLTYKEGIRACVSWSGGWHFSLLGVWEEWPLSMKCG